VRYVGRQGRPRGHKWDVPTSYPSSMGGMSHVSCMGCPISQWKLAGTITQQVDGTSQSSQMGHPIIVAEMNGTSHQYMAGQWDVPLVHSRLMGRPST
jgi:hypothetical protein